MLEITKKDREVVLVNIRMVMASSMMVRGGIIKNTVKVKKLIKLVVCMKDFFVMEKDMVAVNIRILMVQSMMALGKMIRDTVNVL